MLEIDNMQNVATQSQCAELHPSLGKALPFVASETQPCRLGVDW